MKTTHLLLATASLVSCGFSTFAITIPQCPTSGITTKTETYGNIPAIITQAEKLAVIDSANASTVGFCIPGTKPATTKAITSGVTLTTTPVTVWMQAPNSKTQTLYTIQGSGKTNYQVHIVDINLSDPSIQVIPSLACLNHKKGSTTQDDHCVDAKGDVYPAGTSVQPIPAMVKDLQQNHTVYAGINGGYDYRIDVSGFSDNICQNRNDDKPVIGKNQMGNNYLRLVENGKVVVENPNCPGTNQAAYPMSAPTMAQPALFLNGDQSYMSFIPTPQLLQPGKQPLSILGAGPMLVKNGEYYLLSPKNSHGGFNIYIDDTELGGAVAVGLLKENDQQHMLLVAVDGQDGDTGMNNFVLAAFMNALKVNSAMALGNGGDATLWVKDGEKGSVVMSGSGTPRPVYDGLFVIGK